MSGARQHVSQVFTPRSPQVNPDMYIRRQGLEQELERALRGSLHTIIYGDSGCGKSWLYKKVLGNMGWHSVLANCANASRMGSLTKEIFSCAAPAGKATLDGYTETKGANIAGAKLEHTKKYDIPEADPLLLGFEAMSKQADGRASILVLDNLEQIFSSAALMEELGNIIILLDDLGDVPEFVERMS